MAASCRKCTVEGIEVYNAPALDRIHVFWMNSEPFQGYVTIICYGQAWTAYFGGMTSSTIQHFFADCNVPYLVNKLSNGKTTKKQDAYLGRIVVAVKESLVEAKAS